MPRQQSCCSSLVDLHANAAQPSFPRSCEHHLCTAASPGEPYHTDTANPGHRGSQAMLLAPYTKCFADPNLPLYSLTANLPRDRCGMQSKIPAQCPLLNSGSHSFQPLDYSSAKQILGREFLHTHRLDWLPICISSKDNSEYFKAAWWRVSQISGLGYLSPSPLEKVSQHSPFHSRLLVWLNVHLLISWDSLQSRGLCKGLINYKWSCLPEVDTRRCD